MNIEDTINLSEQLIAHRSLSGAERSVLDFLCSYFERLSWTYERIAVDEERYNILVRFGVPRIIFSTHVDVVPGADELFSPRRRGDALWGRGACDAKGIAAAMIAACAELQRLGASDFGLLLVVGEEHDGMGAKTAARFLEQRGIAYLINGEPTEGKLITAHKGALDITLSFRGTACHSGYPERGTDANRALIEAAAKLLGANFGVDVLLGQATVNIGVLEGGSSATTVSPSARLKCSIRTVDRDHESIIAQVQSFAPEASLSIGFNCPPAELMVVPGFETDVAAFCSDIPNFAELGASCLLYGPGSIHRAHTDDEFITRSELAAACSGYQTLYEQLQDVG